MDEIEEFMENMYDSTRWYHERSKEQREFDDLVVAELVCGKKVGSAVRKGIRLMPTMEVFLTNRTMSEIKEYYTQLRRLEQEIGIANNMQILAAMRKRKAQTKDSPN